MLSNRLFCFLNWKKILQKKYNDLEPSKGTCRLIIPEAFTKDFGLFKYAPWTLHLFLNPSNALSPKEKMTSLWSTLNHSMQELRPDNNHIKIGLLCQNCGTVIPLFYLWQWPTVTIWEVALCSKYFPKTFSLPPAVYGIIDPFRWLSDFQKQLSLWIAAWEDSPSCMKAALFNFFSIFHLLVSFKFISVRQFGFLLEKTAKSLSIFFRTPMIYRSQ